MYKFFFNNLFNYFSVLITNGLAIFICCSQFDISFTYKVPHLLGISSDYCTKPKLTNKIKEIMARLRI